MRYAYIHTAEGMTGNLHLIIIERGGENYQYYSTHPHFIKDVQDSFTYVREELGKKRTRLEDAVGPGYSYYSKEIGKYEGAKKRKIDAIIKEHGM